MKKFSINSENYLKRLVKNLRIYNPLPKYFYGKIVFYTWRHYTNLTFDKLKFVEQKGYFENFEDSEENEKECYYKLRNPDNSFNFGEMELKLEPIENPIRSVQAIPHIIITKNE